MTVALRPPREPLDPRVRTWWRVHCVLGPLVPAVVLLVLGLLVAPVSWFVPVAVALVVAGLVVAAVFPAYWYRVHRWEVTDTAVYTQTGWWRRERRIAPMSRIQTVDYVEGAISRLFRLASVTATTASAAGALEIAGLDRDRARSLVDELTLKADAIPGDAT